MSMCVSKLLNKAFLIGGDADELTSDDVYCWDLINDRVNRRNHMPYRIERMNEFRSLRRQNLWRLRDKILNRQLNNNFAL